MKGRPTVGPTRRYSAKTLARFKEAWNEGVATWAMAERFGINKANMHVLARRLGLRKRARS